MAILLHLRGKSFKDSMIESFLFLFTSIIGFVTLILMLRSYKSNPFCNFFMVLIIGLVTLRFFIHGSYHLGLQSFLKPDKGIVSLLYLVIAPSSYLYYKNLIFQKKQISFKDLKHFIFIVCMLLINAIPFLRNSFIFYFGNVTNLFFVSVYILFYLCLNFVLLKDKIWFKENIISNKDHFNLIKNWTFYFYIINVFCSVLLFVSLYSEINQGVKFSGKSMAFFLLIFWLFIFFKILLSPEILYGLPILNKTVLKFNEISPEKEAARRVDISNNWILENTNKRNSQDQRLEEKIKLNIENYIKEVERLSTEKLIFRNQKISQNSIAVQLGVPTSHIVYLFKHHSNISFSEYRMKSRIEDAISLIEDGFLNTETFESLAYTSGFSSYNPFFSAFKKITNYSPQDYVKSKIS